MGYDDVSDFSAPRLKLECTVLVLMFVEGAHIVGGELDTIRTQFAVRVVDVLSSCCLHKMLHGVRNSSRHTAARLYKGTFVHTT